MRFPLFGGAEGAGEIPSHQEGRQNYGPSNEGWDRLVWSGLIQSGLGGGKKGKARVGEMSVHFDIKSPAFWLNAKHGVYNSGSFKLTGQTRF